MLKIDRWIHNKLVQNLFIWFLLFLILMSTIQSEDRSLAALFGLALLVPPVYINNLWVLPYLKKNRIAFILLFALNTLVFSAVAVYFIQVSLKQEFQWTLYFNFLGIMVLALGFASAIKISRDSFARRQQDKEAELKLLKAQLNPHFLFNTLNNLYGLSVIKSDKLPGLMLKLSDLLRYSLYETKEAFVSLDKELGYLENYVSLEQIRLEDQTEIKFENRAKGSSLQIAPMLLIVFVENAFKHLDISEATKSRVHISVVQKANKLEFSCINSFDPKRMEIEQLEKGRSGIGLKNAEKRLALMYPNKHQLTTTKNENEYLVELSLTL